MFRKCTSIVSIFGLLLSGCTAGTYERKLMRLSPDQSASTRKAPFNGQYRLYAINKDALASSGSTSVLERSLNKGDAVGFARDELGRLMAVARAERIPLTDFGHSADPAIGEYRWTMQPDPGQPDVVADALLIGAGVAVTAIVVCAAVAALTPFK